MKKILLIDIPNLTELLKRMLRSINREYQISVSNSLETAIKIIQHTVFDLIMIDPYCKKSQSFDEIVHFLEVLNSNVPLIDISSEGCPDEIQKKFTARFPKPFLLVNLRSFIEGLDQ